MKYPWGQLLIVDIIITPNYYIGFSKILLITVREKGFSWENIRFFAFPDKCWVTRNNHNV